MTEAISAHKKMAMGITEGNKLKTGGIIRKFANGGAVAESKAANLPAKGAPLKADFNAGKVKVATMKKGGAARGR
jgi:hypothetical protein